MHTTFNAMGQLAARIDDAHGMCETDTYSAPLQINLIQTIIWIVEADL